MYVAEKQTKKDMALGLYNGFLLKTRTASALLYCCTGIGFIQ